MDGELRHVSLRFLQSSADGERNGDQLSCADDGSEWRRGYGYSDLGDGYHKERDRNDYDYASADLRVFGTSASESDDGQHGDEDYGKREQ